MNLKDFTYGMMLLVIPLILIIIIYRYYVFQICKNEHKCIEQKMNFSMNKLSNKMKELNYLKQDNDSSEEVVEGFFSGFADMFLGGSNPEKVDHNNPLKDQMPGGLTGALPSNENKDSPNTDLLESIQSKNKLINSPIKDLDDLKEVNKEFKEKIEEIKPNLNESKKKMDKQHFSPEIVNDTKILKEQVETKPEPSVPMMPNLSNMKCNFYHDKCPDKHIEMGSIGIQGSDAGTILSCGNVENVKPAKAIAKIKNNALSEIIILEKGHGFNPKTPPKVKIMGGKGNDAQVEAVVDDNGYVVAIKIIHPGYNYTETPNVIIDSPMMNSTCHFCCKM